MSRSLTPPPLKPSLLDRAIELVSPAWALRRHQTRATMALSGGYVGAGYSERFAYWQPGLRDADGDTLRDLRELQARSHDLVRNSPIAAGAVETQVTHVIGSGLTMQSRIDAKLLGLSDEEAATWQSYTERRFSLWAESTYCDAADELTFFEQQDLSLRTRIEAGDAFVVLASKPRQGWPFTLALQIFEAHRCCNPNRKPDTDEISAGIERDASGAPVAVHLCDRDPQAAGAKWTRIALRGASGRRNVLHLKRKLRPGQSRGIPELAPIISTLKQMSRYSEAEIDAAVNSAAQAVFVKMDPEAFAQLFDDDAKGQLVNGASRWDGTLRSGSAVNLLPGESVEAPALGRPNPNFDPFMTAFMRFVGMGLNIPAEVLSKHFQSSYSAARAALLDAWRTFQIRRIHHASKFCQPIYEEWLADEVARGAISAPGFFGDALIRAAWSRATWSGDGPGAIDPLKEAKAMRERMDIGVTTLAEETVAYDGGDWEQKHRQRAREKAARVQVGLEAHADGATAGAPASPPADTEDSMQPD
ncbi:MAG: phage portal protein [Methylibium sp.]|nr:phage portal protein [Methylibium sp.]